MQFDGFVSCIFALCVVDFLRMLWCIFLHFQVLFRVRVFVRQTKTSCQGRGGRARDTNLVVTRATRSCGHLSNASISPHLCCLFLLLVFFLSLIPLCWAGVWLVAVFFVAFLVWSNKLKKYYSLCRLTLWRLIPVMIGLNPVRWWLEVLVKHAAQLQENCLAMPPVASPCVIMSMYRPVASLILGCTSPLHCV